MPEVDLEVFEPPVREQLAAASAAVDAAAATGDDAPLAEAYGELGRRLHAYELHEAAAAAYRNALRLAPGDFRWSYHLGILYQATGELGEAARLLQAALAERPDHLPARLRLAEIRSDQGELAAARGELERALEIDPDCALAHFFLGNVAAAEGDPAEAARRYERALELQPRASAVHAPLAVAYRALGEADRANAQLELRGGQAVRLHDPLALALGDLHAGAVGRIRRGARAQIEGDLRSARAEYEKAVAADPENPEARQSLGAVLAQLGETEAAIAEYRAALEITGDNALVLGNLGGLLTTYGDRGEGIRLLERALQIDPTLATARLALGQALLNEGRPAAAEEQYRQILARDAANASARIGLSRALLARQQPEAALAELRAALERDPPRDTATALRLEIAAVLNASGRPAEALALFDRALADDPGEMVLRFARANLLGRLGRYAEAAEEYARYLAARPDDVAARLGEATALAMSGQLARARARLDEGLAATGADPNIQHALAQLLVTTPDPAVRDAERGLELSRRALDGLRSLEAAATVGLALAASGRCEEAIAHERRLLAECEARGGRHLAERLRRRLEHFERTGRCLEPWAA